MSQNRTKNRLSLLQFDSSWFKEPPIMSYHALLPTSSATAYGLYNLAYGLLYCGRQSEDNCLIVVHCMKCSVCKRTFVSYHRMTVIINRLNQLIIKAIKIYRFVTSQSDAHAINIRFDRRNSYRNLERT